MSRPLLIALWLVGLALLAWLALARLQVSGDLRMFMPSPRSAEQRLLLDIVGHGPGSRLLLVALGGAPPEQLAEHSHELREALSERAEFVQVANGDDGAAALDEVLLPYRYLLSPTLDETALDAGFLRGQLMARLQDLASPAAALVEPWIPRDPSLEILRLAERWRPAIEPERVDGVWFTEDHRHALLLLETVDGGFDPQAQRAALAAIEEAFDALDGSSGLQLEISGPGAFSVLLHERTRGEATRLGSGAAVGILLILLLAYRSVRLPLLGALPLATAALAALAVVGLVFGSVHGITLAFGFTLLGLAQDYPVHLFSHLRPVRDAGGGGCSLTPPQPSPNIGEGAEAASGGGAGDGGGVHTQHERSGLNVGATLVASSSNSSRASSLPQCSRLDAPASTGGSPGEVMRGLWPTLLTGAASTCVAYLSFALAGVDGLLQLAVFAIVGLLVAASATRWLLPPLLPLPRRELSDSRPLRRIWSTLGHLPRVRWLLLPLALFAFALLLLLSPRPLWDDSLAGLTPVPAELLQRDGELRAALGAADVRYLLVLEHDDIEPLLQASEALEPALQQLVEAEAIDGFELPSQYLPSASTQRQRQAQLPDPADLRVALESASADLPFKRDLFTPFLADVEAARQATPLSPQALADTPLAARLQSLLPPRTGSEAVGLISLIGVHDPAALATFAATQSERLYLLDLKTASESLSALYRERVLLALAAGVLLLLLALRLALGGTARMTRVIAPVLLASLLSIAVLHGAGISFTLFHLVSLVLAAGLGLDYALFFERAGADGGEQRRTLHAIIVCVLSTLLVFGLLASSSIPVLRAIGLSVMIGVLLQFLLASMLANRSATDAV